jgi:hypothetical protein
MLVTLGEVLLSVVGDGNSVTAMATAEAQLANSHKI